MRSGSPLPEAQARSAEARSAQADPFPREAVGAFVRRIPAYGRLALALARDPRLSGPRRAAVIGALGYLVSPIDLVPGIIPVIGQLDDLLLVLAAIRFALAGLDAEERGRMLAGAGLTDEVLAEDARTLGAAVAWLGRAGLRVAVGVGAAVARTGADVAARVLPAAGRAAPGVARGAQDGLRRAAGGMRDRFRRRGSDGSVQVGEWTRLPAQDD